jgi:uncharacterized membrane protein YjfL (UPF0719 family)
MTAMQLIIKFAEVIVNPLIYVMFGVAFLVFLWGVAEFVRKSASSTASGDGKNHIIWGIVGMVIMVSAFTILRILLGSFEIPVPEVISNQI